MMMNVNQTPPIEHTKGKKLACQRRLVLGSNWIWTVPVLAEEKTEDDEEEAIGASVFLLPPSPAMRG